jgi:hypothetical protein
MPEKQPESIGPDIDTVVLRCLPADILAHFEEYKREYREAIAETEERFKQTKRLLKKRRAKPTAFEELEAEHRQIIAQHRNRLQQRIRDLLAEYLPPAEKEVPPPDQGQ